MEPVRIDATIECDHYLGEVVCNAAEAQGIPPGTYPSGEFQQTIMIGDFTDIAYPPGQVPPHGYLVQLKSLAAPVAVRGHALRYLTNGQAATATYAIARFENGQENFVALFPASEVVGIFEGDAGAAPARVSA